MNVTEPFRGSTEYELDLRPYIANLRRRWPLIILFGVLGAAASFAYFSFRPPVYASTSDIAIVRTGAVVNLNPNYRTISDTDPNAQSFDQVVRRASLTAIGQSPAFAELVVAKAGAQLPEGLRNPQRLAGSVSLSPESDLIHIKATAASAEDAALLANIWANLYVERVNEVFSENPVATDAFQSQIKQARLDYETKQKAQEDFIRSSPIERLTREQDMIAGQLNAEVALQSKLVKLEADAKSLRDLIQSGQGNLTTADQLSTLLIAANTFNASDDLPLRLDVPTVGLEAGTTRAQQIAYLDGLVKAIEARRAARGGEAEKEAYRQLGTIQAELEQAQAKSKDLIAERDLAWNLYQLLLTKVGETAVASGEQNQIVRIANAAIVPAEPVDSRRALNTLLGGIAGLVVGAAVALFIRAN